MPELLLHRRGISIELNLERVFGAIHRRSGRSQAIPKLTVNNEQDRSYAGNMLVLFLSPQAAALFQPVHFSPSEEFGSPNDVSCSHVFHV